MINQIPFSEIDVKSIRHAVHTTWPTGGFSTRESFDDWLRKTHINPALQPYLWALIAAWSPHRYMCYWDLEDVWAILLHKRGQLMESRSDPCETNLSPEAVVEQLRGLLRLASRSQATVISGAIVVVSTCNDRVAYEQLTACLEALQKHLPATALFAGTVVMVGAHEPQSVCLWISE